MAAKLKGFTVNCTAQWFTVVARSLVLPEILSVLGVQVQCFVISGEMCHALASSYLGTVDVLATCHSKLCPPSTRMWVYLWSLWASPRGGAGKVRVTCEESSCVSCVASGCLCSVLSRSGTGRAHLGLRVHAWVFAAPFAFATAVLLEPKWILQPRDSCTLWNCAFLSPLATLYTSKRYLFHTAPGLFFMKALILHLVCVHCELLSDVYGTSLQEENVFSAYLGGTFAPDAVA